MWSRARQSGALSSLHCEYFDPPLFWYGYMGLLFRRIDVAEGWLSGKGNERS